MPARKKSSRTQDAESPNGQGEEQADVKQRKEQKPASARIAGRRWTDVTTVTEDMQPHVKRSFIQIMMKHGMLPQDEEANSNMLSAVGAFMELSGAQDGSTFVDFVADCNQQLAFLEFQIRRLLFPPTNTWFVAFVNTSADDNAKMLAQRYSLSDIAYFRALIEAIAESPVSEQDGTPCISAIDALNLDVDAPAMTQINPTQATQAAIQRGKPLSKDAKQKALAMFTVDGWMAKSTAQRGYGLIGPRTFMALGQWLLSLELPPATRAAWERIL